MHFPHPIEFLDDFRFNVSGFFPAINGRSLDIVGRLGVSYGAENNITVVLNYDYDPFMHPCVPDTDKLIFKPVTGILRPYDHENDFYSDQLFLRSSDPQAINYFFDIIENNKEKFLLRLVQTTVYTHADTARAEQLPGIENLKAHLDRLVAKELIVQRPL